jgi:hypothetical protein
VVGGQHRHECRVHRVLRAKGACPACTRAAQHASPAIHDCPATAGRSNLLLFAYSSLCLQVASCADDPAAGELIHVANFDVVKSTLVDIVGRCAAGRGRPRGELRGELGRGRQPRARGMWPATPRATARAACARLWTTCMRMLSLYFACTTKMRRACQQSGNRCVRVVRVPSQVNITTTPSYSPLCAPMAPAPITCAPLGRASGRD